MHLSWKLQDIVGYSPRSVAAGGRTPLHVAAERGFADVAEVSWLGAMGPSDSMEGSHHFQTWSCTVKMPGISELPIHPGFHPFFCRLCWRMAQNLRIAQRHRVGLRGLRGLLCCTRHDFAQEARTALICAAARGHVLVAWDPGHYQRYQGLQWSWDLTDDSDHG